MKNWENTTIQDRLELLAEQVGGPSALAALFGIHRTSLYGYLKKGKPIPASKLHSFAGLYPCSLSWLTDGQGEPPAPNFLRTFRAHSALKQSNNNHLIDTLPYDQEPTPDGALADSNETKFHQLSLFMKTRNSVLLEPTREQIMNALRLLPIERVQEILGMELTSLVFEGKACPSLELLFRLSPLLGKKLNWIIGLEE